MTEKGLAHPMAGPRQSRLVLGVRRHLQVEALIVFKLSRYISSEKELNGVKYE